MHLDHHIGLPELFRMRDLYLPAKRPKLLIFCPLDNLKSWLNFYSKSIESIYSDMKLIANDDLETGGLSPWICKSLGIDSLATCKVPHSGNSFAITMDIPFNHNGRREKFKLTFSGDTKPDENLVKLAKHSTLLIHEATFQDDLEKMAFEKHHSTISQAIEQSRKSNSAYTILTHFSARYRHIPYMEVDDLPKNVGIAFDNMEVTINDLPRLDTYYPKYRELFQSDFEKMEISTRKYRKKWARGKTRH